MGLAEQVGLTKEILKNRFGCLFAEHEGRNVALRIANYGEEKGIWFILREMEMARISQMLEEMRT